MNRTRNIIRLVLLLLIVLQFISLSRSDGAMGRILKFKYDTFNKIRADSLNGQQRLDSLVTETTKFNRSSPQIGEDLYKLAGLFALLIASEAGFWIARRRSDGD